MQYEGIRQPHIDLVVDTIVMIEFATYVDLNRAKQKGDRWELLDRRRKAQETLWFAMVLDDLGVATWSLHHEVLRKHLALSPPGGQLGAWTSNVAHFVTDYICPAWNSTLSEIDLNLKGTANDRLLVKEAKDRGIPLITRDKPCRTRAAKEGVHTMCPKEFAEQSRLPHAEARRRFFERFERNVLPYIAECLSRKRPVPWEPEASLMCESLRVQYRNYEWIWHLLSPGA